MTLADISDFLEGPKAHRDFESRACLHIGGVRNLGAQDREHATDSLKRQGSLHRVVCHRRGDEERLARERPENCEIDFALFA
jgi:hypothetical protein